MPIYMLPNSGTEHSFYIGPAEDPFSRTLPTIDLPTLLSQLIAKQGEGESLKLEINGEEYSAEPTIWLSLHGVTEQGAQCFIPRESVAIGSGESVASVTGRIKTWYRANEKEAVEGYRNWWAVEHFTCDIALVDKGDLGFEFSRSLSLSGTSSIRSIWVASGLLAIAALAAYLNRNKISVWERAS